VPSVDLQLRSPQNKNALNQGIRRTHKHYCIAVLYPILEFYPSIYSEYFTFVRDKYYLDEEGAYNNLSLEILR
jgi:hypothetical protein